MLAWLRLSLERRWSPKWGIMRHFWIRVYFCLLIALALLINLRTILGHVPVVDEKVTDRLNCENLARLPVLGNIREEKGRNKRVYRARVLDHKIVIKEATQSDWVIQQAEKEVSMARKLLNISSIPSLILHCPLKRGLRYAVDSVEGVNLCSDFYGTDSHCLELESLKKRLTKSGDFERNMWKFISSFATLLTSLREKNYWIEDMSGSNFLVDKEFQVHLVDLDSLRKVESTNKTCQKQTDCPDIVDKRLWGSNSLNHKVSWKCPELSDKCASGFCLSHAKLPECIFGHWILGALSTGVPEMDSAYNIAYLRKCTTRKIITDRCDIDLIKLVSKQVLHDL